MWPSLSELVFAMPLNCLCTVGPCQCTRVKILPTASRKTKQHTCRLTCSTSVRSSAQTAVRLSARPPVCLFYPSVRSSVPPFATRPCARPPSCRPLALPSVPSPARLSASRSRKWSGGHDPKITHCRDKRIINRTPCPPDSYNLLFVGGGGGVLGILIAL